MAWQVFGDALSQRCKGVLQAFGMNGVNNEPESFMTAEQIKELLKQVKYPGYSRDIVSFGLVKNVAINNNAVSVGLELSSGTVDIAAQIKSEVERVLKAVPGIDYVHVQAKAPQGSGQTGQTGNAFENQHNIPGLKRIVAVASGKGGVGKSTLSVNLSCALQHLGVKVGLLDCDIYGPSIPLMMGVNDRPSITPEQKMLPLISHGIKLMSMGFLLTDDQPVIWRGPMIMKTIQQFFSSVDWGELDILLVDLPPGTGDAQISLCQTVPLDGGVIVTTPQEASVGVVRKGIAMFEKVNVPILGIVENMSYYTTPNGERVEIFGHGGGRGESERKGIPFLGEVPIFPEIRVAGDAGKPIAATDPDSPAAQSFMDIAKILKNQWLPES
jgi:ATP-binding protein involved in chromosome partitioning